MAARDDIVNKVLWRIPNVLCLIGSAAGGTWNGMTASWVTQVAMDPVLVAVAIDTKALTHRLIETGGAFSVNLWDREDNDGLASLCLYAQLYDAEWHKREDIPQSLNLGRQGQWTRITILDLHNPDLTVRWLAFYRPAEVGQ